LDESLAVHHRPPDRAGGRAGLLLAGIGGIVNLLVDRSRSSILGLFLPLR
jgi:hypothetical protein